ncbi:hypothetical protein [Desulfosporosinus hippei]|uniref:Uncharacterized protein n=1 Tax=Desulfosporosinus hippei DSM 8344 TaxID=1121419 RepID=A0A1G7YVK7_9FIRM|nr:hypothetical protein [Desulfosporosinus hippei]SDH00427.1 hypothetical protein SAMN05443529_108166 [Desulfosporosinus hippei DSM 8344]
MKKKSILIFIIVYIIVCCTGCIQETTSEEKKQSIMVSTGMRFCNNGTTIREENININSNTLDIEIGIDNDYPFENIYTLILLNNGKQEKYYIDKQMYLNYDISINEKSNKIINVGIRNLNNGPNELIFMLYREDQRIPKDIFISPGIYLTYKAITVCVNDQDSMYSPQNSEPALEILQNYGEDVKGIFLVKNSDCIRKNGVEVLTQENLQDTDIYKFNLFRNISKTEFSKGIFVVFLDNKQIEVYNNGKKYFNLISNNLQTGKTLIPVELEIKEPGTHSCFALFIGYSNKELPYMDRLYVSNLLFINKR